jgi:hypothetical protein
VTAPDEPLRRLPVPVRLIGREAIGSFLTRLAFANSLHVAHLLSLAGISRARSFTPATDDTAGWSPSTPDRVAAPAAGMRALHRQEERHRHGDHPGKSP